MSSDPARERLREALFHFKRGPSGDAELLDALDAYLDAPRRRLRSSRRDARVTYPSAPDSTRHGVTMANRERTHEENTALLALYVATAGVEGAAAKEPVIEAFAEAFTYAELEDMARKLTAARKRLNGVRPTTREEPET